MDGAQFSAILYEIKAITGTLRAINHNIATLVEELHDMNHARRRFARVAQDIETADWDLKGPQIEIDRMKDILTDRRVSDGGQEESAECSGDRQANPEGA